MVIDSSALLAVLFGEPEAKTFARAIASDPRRLLSGNTLSIKKIHGAIKLQQDPTERFHLLNQFKFER